MTTRQTWTGFASCLAAISIAAAYATLTPRSTAAPRLVAEVEAPQAEKIGDPAVDCPDARPLTSSFSAQIPELSSVQELDGFRVKGKALVTNRRPGAHAFWVVRIAPAEGYRFSRNADPDHPVFVASYADRAFEVALDEEVELKFEEAVFPQLPAGKYCVELHLIHLRPGLTPAIIRDNDHMMRLSSAGRAVKNVLQ